MISMSYRRLRFSAQRRRRPPDIASQRSVPDTTKGALARPSASEYVLFHANLNAEKNRRTPEETMTESRLLDHARPNRRSLLKSAALGSVAAIAAPYVKSTYAAGSLALGVWDHWVPGAN